MRMTLRKGTAVVALALGVAALASGAALAQSLGIGANEVAIEPTGPFAHVLYWIASEQREFYRAMTAALSIISSTPTYSSGLCASSSKPGP